jgi:hypothetical protein
MRAGTGATRWRPCSPHFKSKLMRLADDDVCRNTQGLVWLSPWLLTQE